MPGEVWQENPDLDRFQSRSTAPAVKWLLILNIAVYFLQVTLGDELIYRTLALFSDRFPSTPHEWATMFTYMFVHGGIWHLSFNMLTLWMFGTRVEQAWSTKNFLLLYLWCGLGGALVHVLLVRQGLLMGASAAVIGVMLAYAKRWPNDMIYFFGIIPVRARWLALWMIVINLVFGIGLQDGGDGGGIAWFAHLGGLLFGWIYLKLHDLRKLNHA